MSKEVFLTILRQVMLSLGSIVSAKFAFIDGSTWEAVAGGVVALAAIVWGIVSKSKDVTKVQAAQTVLATAATPVSDTQIAAAAAKVQK